MKPKIPKPELNRNLADSIWSRMTWSIDQWHDRVNELEGRISKVTSLVLPCYGALDMREGRTINCDEKDLCDACRAREILNGV